MKEGTGYNRFKNGWRFSWETINIPEIKKLTPEERDALIKNHSKYIKPKK